MRANGEATASCSLVAPFATASASQMAEGGAGAAGAENGEERQDLRISVQLTPQAAECLAALNRMAGRESAQDLAVLQGVNESEFAERVRSLAAEEPHGQLSDADVATITSELSPVVRQLSAIAQGQNPNASTPNGTAGVAQPSNASNSKDDDKDEEDDDDDDDDDDDNDNDSRLATRSPGDGTSPMSAQEKKKLSKDERHKVDIRERMQAFRIKMLRIATRFNQNQRNSVISQALHRMDMAEQMKLGGSVTGSTPASAANGSSVQAALEDAQHLESQDPLPMLDIELTVLAIGNTGVGKTNTLNSLFGTDLHVDHLQRGTGKAQLVHGRAAGVHVNVIDTPGLSGSSESIRENCRTIGQAKRLASRKKPDIVLYFDRLDMPMRDESDLQLLRMITDTFGASVWFNAIVVLTHASKAPPENAAGQQINYEQYTSQRSQMVQQVLRTAAGDMRLMNPVALAENHPQCRTNASGQQVLPNGQAWKPQLLLLCFASKLLSDANKTLNLQSGGKSKSQGGGQQQKSPPLPFLLSSLIQSRQPHKEDNPGETEDDFEEVITPAAERPAEDESEEKAIENEEEEENNEEEKKTPARQVHIPAPDPALPPSFDADNPSHKYRFLESGNQWVVRPVVEAHGWDHEAGVEGFKVEKSANPYNVMPGSISGQLSKDKKELSVQAEAEGTNHFFPDDKVVVTSGVDVQNVSSDTLAYTARSEARWRNMEFPRTGGSNKTAAGGSLATVAGIPAGGVKIEDRLKPLPWAKVVGNSGVVLAKGDRAVGGNLEMTVKHSDDASDPLCTTLNGSFMHWRGGGRGGDLALGANGSSQFDVPGGVQMTVSGNINSRGSGKISVRGSSNERLQVGLGGLVPVAAAIVGRARGSG